MAGSYSRPQRDSRRGNAQDIPVFDRGKLAPADPELRAHLTPKVSRGAAYASRYRTAADRQGGVPVTGRLLGDPPPWRAGRAPDCEESRKVDQSEEAYRLLGKEPPSSDRYALLDLDDARRQADRLKPRRYRPAFKEAAE